MSTIDLTSISQQLKDIYLYMITHAADIEKLSAP
jgi:hypothetical protein